MNKIEKLKADAEKKLEEALKKQQAIIDAQKMLIDSYEKLKVGNIIICDIGWDWIKDKLRIDKNEVFLIVSEPFIEDEKYIIPIRHHIYPILGDKSIRINMSGVVDLLSVPIDKIADLKVISVDRYLHEQKTNICEMWNEQIKEYKKYISDAEHRIKDAERTIEINKKRLEECKDINIDVNLDIFITNYIYSDNFKKFAFDGVRFGKNIGSRIYNYYSE